MSKHLHVQPTKDYAVSITSERIVLYYLAQKAVELCKVPITPHTHEGVLSSKPNMVSIQRTQEEADIMLLIYAVAVSHLGINVHIYTYWCGSWSKSLTLGGRSSQNFERHILGVECCSLNLFQASRNDMIM